MSAKIKRSQLNKDQVSVVQGTDKTCMANKNSSLMKPQACLRDSSPLALARAYQLLWTLYEGPFLQRAS
jgi:hypothetical protein